MSDLVKISTNNLPAHLSDRIGKPSALSGALTAGISTGGSSFKRISIRGGRFRIRDGSNEQVLPDTTLRAIIVGASPNVTKSFYKGAYNPKAVGDEKKPDCFSTDGIRPDKNAEDPQSQLCANCPQNAWGSKITDTGSKMKACADQKRLAIISADDMSDDPEVYLFQVTPAALKQFALYGEALASKGFSPEIVVTKISFDPKEAYPKAQFDFGDFIKEEQAPVIDKLVKSDRVKEIIGTSTQEAVVVEEPKKPSPIKVKEEAYVPPPVVVEDAEFEEAPPVKTTSGFGASPAQTVTSSALSDDIKNMLANLDAQDD